MSERKETGIVTVWTMQETSLKQRSALTWTKGAAPLRVRTVAAADLDGDGRAEMIAGGVYDTDGKPCLGVLRLVERGSIPRIRSRFRARRGARRDQGRHRVGQGDVAADRDEGGVGQLLDWGEVD